MSVKPTIANTVMVTTVASVSLSLVTLLNGYFWLLPFLGQASWNEFFNNKDAEGNTDCNPGCGPMYTMSANDLLKAVPLTLLGGIAAAGSALTLYFAYLACKGVLAYHCRGGAVAHGAVLPLAVAARPAVAPNSHAAMYRALNYSPETAYRCTVVTGCALAMIFAPAIGAATLGETKPFSSNQWLLITGSALFEEAILLKLMMIIAFAAYPLWRCARGCLANRSSYRAAHGEQDPPGVHGGEQDPLEVHEGEHDQEGVVAPAPAA